MTNQTPLSQIKKSVSFIYLKNENGQYVANGTAFFVSVINEENPKLQNIYLVTAKHVLQQSNSFVSSFILRLNNKKNESNMAEVKLKQINIFTHTEPEVDIAVIPIAPEPEVYDYLNIPASIIATKEIMEQEKVSEGDEVFFAGMFVNYLGQKKIQPIVRFGKISLLPEEKIEWDNEQIECYLVELQAYGGNSGAPLFFYLAPFRHGSGNLSWKYLLGGVIKGSFLTGSKIQQIAIPQSNSVAYQNIGISAITPAYKLHEILFSKGMISNRSEIAKSGAEVEIKK